MVSGKNDKEKSDKGVNVHPKCIWFSDTDSISTPCTKSLNKIKNEVKTVIELMGPNTPNFNDSSLTNVENDESLYSNTTDNSMIKTKDTSKSECLCTDVTIPPDVTMESDYSVMVDKNSTTFPDTLTSPQVICPPPLLPANVVFNSECMCPQMEEYIRSGPPTAPKMKIENYTEVDKRNKSNNLLQTLFKNFREKGNGTLPGKGEFYTINIKNSSHNQGVPKRLVFDLVDNATRVNECNCCISNSFMPLNNNLETKENKNICNRSLTKQELFKSMNLPSTIPKNIEDDYKSSGKLHQKTTYSDDNGTTRVDVYYFDHGSSKYLRTTDSPPVVTTEALAERTEAYTTIFWAEIFGTIHIGISFCTSFILQLVRFLLYSILRPLTIGLIQLISDYFFKPCLTTTYNGLVQPPMIFLYNVATSLRDLCDPIAEGLGYFLREIAFLVRSFRFVDVKNETCCTTRSSRCDRKVDRKCKNNTNV